MRESLQAIDLVALWDELVLLVREPQSNLTASLLLFGMALALVLILVGTVAALVSGSMTRRRNSQELAELQDLLAILEADEGESLQASASKTPLTLLERVRGYRWLRALTVVAVTLTVLGVSLGASTASTAACVGCHDATPHSNAVRAGVADSHAAVGCVRCHESAGSVGTVTTEVPGRFVHFVNGLRRDPHPDDYGTVVSAPCYRCHASVRGEVTHDEERGVKMAHEHPLAAGAECRDCHTSSNGVVSSLTVGMTPCLRCHDGEKVSADCEFCHTKDVGYATRARTGPAQMSGRELIDTPDCGGCHDQEKNCDPCHGGVRMPHTDLFKWWGHAREGVKDVWDNDGKACGTCHTESRRPCTKCHAFFPGHPTTSFRTGHQVDDTGSCDPCHNGTAYTVGRDLCALCHSKPYVVQ